MATTNLQRVEIVQPDRTIVDSVSRRQELMEETCLTALSVLGGLLFLVLLLVVIELLYYGMTLQNEMFVLPTPGAS